MNFLILWILTILSSYGVMLYTSFSLIKNIFEKPAEHCFEQVSEMTEHNAMVRIGG